jgi:hypothetical protein
VEERGEVVNRATGKAKFVDFEHVYRYCKERMKNSWNSDVQLLDAFA